MCWSFQTDLLNFLQNFISVNFEDIYQYSKLVGRVSNPKLLIITWSLRWETSISLEFFIYNSISGKWWVKNRPNSKRLMHKYLGNLFSKIFSIYSNLNSKHRNNVRTCCIITITNCNYSGFKTVWKDPRILLYIYEFSWEFKRLDGWLGWNPLELSYNFTKAEVIV